MLALTVLAAMASQCLNITRRVDCGYSGITPANCVSRGCCYDKAQDEPSCFYNSDGLLIKKVHVLQSNHFDAGYTAGTTEVINKYFTEYFLMAGVVGNKLDEAGSAPRLRWMTQGYLVWLYLNCPSGLGLICPTEEEIAAFKKSVSKGYITWHAFTHNAELASIHPSMLSLGVKGTHELDDLLNVSRKAVLSQRDVPGVPRSSLPILASQGVKGISVGGNGRVNPPNVPQAFIWKDASSTPPIPLSGVKDVNPPSNAELFTLWHGYGYGQLSEAGLWATEFGGAESPRVELPNFAEAAVYAWRGDNAGPPTSASSVEATWKQIQSWYPEAEIVASDLDTYVAAVLEAGDTVLSKLPTVTEDLSDTWIMGVQADPWKASMARAYGRSFAKTSDPDNSTLTSAKLALKNGEHTWGLHVSTYGPLQTTHWDNTAFHQDLRDKNIHLETLVASWVEQRDYGIRKPMELLPQGSQMQQMMAAETARLAPAKFFNTSGTPVSAEKPLTLGWCTVTPMKTGGLRDIIGSKILEGTFGEFIYQTLNDDVFSAWRAQYLLPGSGGANEYGKPGVTPNISANATYTGQASWHTDGKQTLKARLTMDSDLVTNYGAPAEVWVTYDFSTVDVVEISVQFENKTATRLPEASYLKFTPTLKSGEYWLMDKLGEWTDPLQVLNGSSKGLHAVTSGVAFGGPQGGSFIASLDTSLTRWGPGLYPFCAPMVGDIAPSDGVAFVMHDNSWNTNYPFWYPFSDTPDGTEASIKWDFSILL